MGIPMAYNTGTTNTYTEKTVKRGTVALNPGPTLASGYNWWNGVDATSSQYLIYSDTYTTGQATQANSRPTAWTTPDLTDTSLLNLINTLPERIGQTPFTYLPVALKWLHQSNRYFLLKNNFENIVTSGLVLNLDASWPNSFSGTTTWYDLSGQGNNGTLTNGPTLNTANGGSIQFDGTNDYIQTISPFGDIDWSTRAWSFSAWMKLSSLGDRALVNLNSSNTSHYIVTNVFYGDGASYWYFIKNSTNTQTNFATPYSTFMTNEIFNFTMTYNGNGLSTNNIQFYKNGIQLQTSLGGSAGLSNISGVQIGYNYWLNGYVYNFLMYDKVLLPSEIMQNFNAQGYRFGYSADTIVTSGLTINLDAANGMSYPGTGTTWYDISQTGGYHFTLRNGANFQSYNGINCISFDGSDDNARWIDTNGIREDIGTECTISIWMNGNGVNLGQDCCRLISFNNNVDLNVDYTDYMCMAACNKIGYLPCYRANFGGLCPGGQGSNTPMYTTDFKLVTLTWSTISDTIEVFVNNSSIYSASLTAAPFDYRNVKRIALASNAGNLEYSNIRIASMQMYSRKLSASELTQNYNAQKGRFGL